MRVKFLEVSNLFSFNHFRIELDERLTVVVGANGAGKTSVLRVMDAVTKLVDWSDERARSSMALTTAAEAVVRGLAQARHDAGPPGAPIEIAMGVEWDAPLERARITSFVRAALLAVLIEETRSTSAPEQVLSDWVESAVTDEALREVFAGCLVFSHSGHEADSWFAGYRIGASQSHDWVLRGPDYNISLVAAGAGRERGSASSTSVTEALFGASARNASEFSLPDPMPGFDLEKLLLPWGQSLAPLIMRGGQGIVSEAHGAFRDAIDSLELPRSVDMGQQTYGLARPLSLNLRDGLTVLGEQFRGLGVGGTVPWRAGVYPLEMLGTAVPIQNPAFLPLRLLRLKNGDTPPERERYEEVRAAFNRLAPKRHFDVTFSTVSSTASTPMPIAAGQVVVPNDPAALARNVFASEPKDQQHERAQQPALLVSVVVWEDPATGEVRKERPIQLWGAGTWEALVLAETLSGTENRVLALDEPATTLHPTWQGVLQSELKKTPGQVILVSHSPALVPMESGDDLARVVRLAKVGHATTLRRLPDRLLTARAARIVRAFALSADARGLLFCRATVLTEGETELGALPIWFAKSKTAREYGTPLDLDLGFFGVYGDGGYTNVLSVLGGFGIPWSIACDGLAFDVEARWSHHIFRQVLKADVSAPQLQAFIRRFQKSKSARKMTQDVWDEEIPLGAQNGIFTLASGWEHDNESFESFIEWVAPGMLAQAEAEVGRSKVRIGRWIANATTCPQEVDDLYRHIVERVRRGS